jgi:hypothetical protein
MMIEKLQISDQLTLIHDTSQHHGKTAGMAKGLFLCYQDVLYAGESAGFGVPVWKTSRQTYFPTLVTARWQERNVFEMVFRLDRLVRWQVLGIPMPGSFSAALEKITRTYMQRPEQQKFLLRVRNALFGMLQMKSSMKCDSDQGDCLVTYEAQTEKLLIAVDGRSLRGEGELIMLNEVAGRPFTRLRIGESVQDGHDIPAWQPCPRTATLENPAAGIGFSIFSAESQPPPHWHLHCGREVGRGLNWAGLELTADRDIFSYGIAFTAGQPCE